MGEPTLLLWDVGGVLLTNAWDREERATAATHFQLPLEELERRHAEVVEEFETGQLTLQEYLSHVVFHEPRPFSEEDFAAYMRSLSKPHPAALAAALSLRKQGRYLMATLNNESRELHEYRARTFHLGELFEVFFVSYLTGLRKPDPGAYRLALELTARSPEQCLFLDDRPENVRVAEELGIPAIQVSDPERLPEALSSLGVPPGVRRPWNWG
jgi:putative hydrolase of the HAD superfamily